MNHAYRLVWNCATQTFVPAPETARARGKSSGRGTVLVTLTMAAVLGACVAHAGPTGGQVSAGSGHIAQSDSITTITQASQNLSINWASFNVAGNERVNFVQPNASAIALNRVLGTGVSRIDGTLSANGQVWILNPNGVLFGSQAQVSVGGLVASTLSLNDADFLAGRRTFSADGGQGRVTNQGTLTGGYVALLGQQVSNDGRISTPNGSTVLAAGDQVTLDFSGNKMLSVQVNAGTLNALAQNKGVIHADNGVVILTASAKEALLDTVVNNTGVIEARGLDASGGRILLLGGPNGGTVNVAGTLDASASGSGEGGFIETSGAHVQVADGTSVNTQAASGLTGTWLIDPTDFTISSGSGGQTSSGIGATTLTSNLANTSVTLATDASTGTGNGDINVNAAVSWNANTTLTLNAYRNIDINAAVTATGTSAKLALNFGNYATAHTATTGTDYIVAAPVTLGGSNASLLVNGSAYTLIHNMAGLPAMSVGSGRYALAQDLDASGATYTAAVVSNFHGTFAGLGHTVSNLAISGGTRDIGLIGVNAGTVRDIGVVNASLVGGGFFIGALAGENTTTGSISNAYATGTVSITQFGGGGLVGFNSGRISNSYAASRVTGGYYGGGLAGLNYGSINNSRATGDVSGTKWLGGLVGKAGPASTIDNSYATGSVTGSAYGVGGLVGRSQPGGRASNTYATGNVTAGQGMVGGLFGSNSGIIESSYATGSVVVTGGNYGGGLSGINQGTIRNAYATGSVASTADYVGGLVGWNTAVVSNTYATGSVTGPHNVGGLIGQNDGSVIASLWLSANSAWAVGSIVGNPVDGLTRGLSSTEANSLATYTAAGWDIGALGGTASPWRIYDGYTMPLLRGLLTPITVSVTGISGKTYDRTVAGGSTGYTLSDPSATLLGSGLSYVSTSAHVGNYSSAAGTLLFAGLYSNQQGYDISYANASLSIDRASLTVGGASAANRTYDATTVATVTGGTLSGVLSGDAVTLSQQGTFSDKNVGVGKTVSLNLGGADASNYMLAGPSATTTANIGAATLTASGASAANKTYDATTVATVTGGTLTGVLSGDAVTLNQSGTFNDKNVGVSKAVTATFGISGADAGNYVLANSSATTTANISAATLTASGASAANKIYDSTTVATVTGGTLSGVLGGDVVTLDQSGAFNDKNVGVGKTVTSTFGISGADAGNYVLASSSATSTANINAATLTASGASAANKIYDATTDASISGGTLGGVFSGDAVTLSQHGTFGNKNVGVGKAVALNLSGADAANYVLASSSATSTANIDVATLTASGATAANKSYDATTVATVTGGTLTGVLSGDAVTLNQSGTFNDKNVGVGKTVTETLGISGADAGNYVLANSSATTTANISAATLTASGASAANKTYDATTVATVAGGTLTGVLSGDIVTLNQSGTFNDKNVGAGKAVTEIFGISGADAGNYVLASTSGTTTANIAAATLTASGASAANKTYDATTVATVTGGTLTGVLSGDAVTLSQHGTFSDKNAGVGKTVTLNLSGADAGNYVLANSSATTAANIAAATLTASGASTANKIYDATTVATVTGGTLTGVLNGDVVALNQSGTFNDKNVGVGKTVTETFGISGADAGNYVLGNSSATTTANIAAATLTASGASAANKTYDATTVATVTGGTLTGVLSGDVVTLNQSGTFNDKNVGAGKTVTETFGISGAGAGNYVLANSSVTTTANIAAATLTASGASTANKIYDATTVATVTGGTLTGVLNGDVVALNQSGTFNDKNVGAGKTVTEAFGISGGDAGNYVLANSSATTTANITAATLTANGAGAANKTYDATTVATVTGGALSGVLSGDAVTLNQSGTFNDKNVGVGKTVTETFGISGADVGNYVLASTGGTTTANIAAATLTASGASAANKIYDATTVATVTGGTLTGVLSGDVVTLNQSGTFNDKNVGASKTVTEAFGISGADAGNYVLSNSSATTAANITATTLMANGASAANKIYDATTVATVAGGTLTGVLSGDIVTLNQSGTFNDKNVGAGKTVTETFGISGADAGNYVLANSSATTAANITAATLTASGASAANRTYDATTVATVTGGTLSGVLSGDAVTLNQSGAFNDKNVGVGKTVTETFGISGADVGNYVLGNTGGTTTANIAAATLTASGAHAANKTYDATTVATVTGGTLSGVLSGDVVTLDQAGAFNDKNVRVGKTVTETFGISGADAGNYVLANSSATTTANITAVTLAVNGARAANKVYDTTTVASVTGGNLTGVLSGDTVTLNQNGAFNDKNVGVGKTVTTTFGISGADAGNYVLANSSSTTTANITAATLTASGASTTNKTYDATTLATVTGGTLSGVLSGDVVTLSQHGAFDNKNVGVGKTVTETFGISGADVGNYVLANSTATTTATISPTALTIAANNDSRVGRDLSYSGGNGVSYSGFVAGEGSGVLAGSLSYGGSSQGAVKAGSYSIVPSGLTAQNYAITYVNGTLVIRDLADGRMIDALTDIYRSGGDTGGFETLRTPAGAPLLTVQRCGVRLDPSMSCTLDN